MYTLSLSFFLVFQCTCYNTMSHHVYRCSPSLSLSLHSSKEWPFFYVCKSIYTRRCGAENNYNRSTFRVVRDNRVIECNLCSKKKKKEEKEKEEEGNRHSPRWLIGPPYIPGCVYMRPPVAFLGRGSLFHSCAFLLLSLLVWYTWCELIVWESSCNFLARVVVL